MGKRRIYPGYWHIPEPAPTRGGRRAAVSSEADYAIRQLRHLYMQMVNGHVHPTGTDIASAARGMLGPAIEILEREADARRAADLTAEEVEALRELADRHRCDGTGTLCAESNCAEEQSTVALLDRLIGGAK